MTMSLLGSGSFWKVRMQVLELVLHMGHSTVRYANQPNGARIKVEESEGSYRGVGSGGAYYVLEQPFCALFYASQIAL